MAKPKTRNAGPPLGSPLQPRRTHASDGQRSTQDLPESTSAVSSPSLDKGFEHETFVKSPIEMPLQRPAGVTNPIEKPLKRPLDIDRMTAFKDSTVAFAIDVSGSTIGTILEQEINAGYDLCDCLSADAAGRATIIPWDNKVYPSRNTSCFSRRDLTSNGGGTSPSALTSGLSSSEVLGDCTAWVLFTDGEISDKEVRQFSKGITENGLHGTACIIVLFGYKHGRPLDCNISVGLSIFSTAPDCLFLFHDVDSEVVYMLQSKGVFNELLPKGQDMLHLSENTAWNDLPTIVYNVLSRIRLPPPQKLSPGELLLQNKHIVRLEDIYNDEMDAETTTELLDNDDNLKTLLLAGQIKGEKENVKRWIAKQRIGDRDMLLVPRPDIGLAASKYIRSLLSAQQKNAATNKINRLQAKLRAAHRDNWTRLLSDSVEERKKVSRRAEIVTDALDRIYSNELEDESQSYSPSMLGTVSPGGRMGCNARVRLGSGPQRTVSQQPPIWACPPFGHPFTPK